MRVEWGIAAAFGPLLCFEALMGPKTIPSKPRSLEVTEEKRRKFFKRVVGAMRRQGKG